MCDCFTPLDSVDLRFTPTSQGALRVYLQEGNVLVIGEARPLHLAVDVLVSGKVSCQIDIYRNQRSPPFRGFPPLTNIYCHRLMLSKMAMNQDA